MSHRKQWRSTMRVYNHYKTLVGVVVVLVSGPVARWMSVLPRAVVVVLVSGLSVAIEPAHLDRRMSLPSAVVVVSGPVVVELVSVVLVSGPRAVVELVSGLASAAYVGSTWAGRVVWLLAA